MLTSSKGNTGQSEYQQSSLGSGTKKVEPYCRIDASTPNGTKLKQKQYLGANNATKIDNCK